jgi:Na+/proline symporter
MKENQQNQIGQEIKYQLAGWILFIICAIFFIASGLKNHDILTFIGGVIFLIACIVFLIPLVRPNKKAKNKKSYNQANAADTKSRAAD